MALGAKHNEMNFHVGDTVRIHYRIIEHEKIAGKTKRSVEEKVKERIQPYEGIVMSIKGVAENKSFTVRRLADQNIGVERVFPLVSPWIERIEVMQRGKPRRAKLYYLRNRGNLDVKAIHPETKKARAKRKATEAKKNKEAKKANETPKPTKATTKSPKKSTGSKGRTASRKVSSK